MTVEAAEHEPTTADRTVLETVPGPFDAALARLGAIQGDALERGTVGFDGFRGQAFVTGRATLLFDPRDPFREGFSVAG